jgi:acyl-coenzyme A synthetase/AMP-(fatty) acid ligase
MDDLIEAFLYQVSRNGNIAAVEDANITVSFRDLFVLSSNISKTFLKISGANSKVLVYLDPSANAYAAMIATLMTGGTFCAVATDTPAKRTEEIIDTFEPNIIAVNRLFSINFSVDRNKFKFVEIGSISSFITSTMTINTPHNKAAYVVFTSGSTGKPKGICISRKGFSYFVNLSQVYFNLRPGDRWAQ